MNGQGSCRETAAGIQRFKKGIADKAFPADHLAQPVMFSATGRQIRQ